MREKLSWVIEEFCFMKKHPEMMALFISQVCLIVVFILFLVDRLGGSR